MDGNNMDGENGYKQLEEFKAMTLNLEKVNCKMSSKSSYWFQSHKAIIDVQIIL